MAHIPVLVNEVIACLVPSGSTIERAIDGTLGAGGHTKALLEAGEIPRADPAVRYSARTVLHPALRA